jgi:predicted nuclease with TOPRIM domain
VVKLILWVLDYFRLKLDPQLEVQVEAERVRARQLDREYADLKHANEVKERLIAEGTKRRNALVEELVSLTREGDEIDRRLREVRSEKVVLPDRPADVLRADL